MLFLFYMLANKGQGFHHEGFQIFKVDCFRKLRRRSNFAQHFAKWLQFFLCASPDCNNENTHFLQNASLLFGSDKVMRITVSYKNQNISDSRTVAISACKNLRWKKIVNNSTFKFDQRIEHSKKDGRMYILPECIAVWNWLKRQINVFWRTERRHVKLFSH